MILVFDGLREKIGEKVVFGSLRKLPKGARYMARAAAVNKSVNALNTLEKSGQELLIGLKAKEFNNNLIRNAWKLRDFIKDNKRLYTDQDERKDDLFACNELIDSLVKDEFLQENIVWLEVFILKFPVFKKELFVFFDKALPI
jgi:hypothetical protein